MTSNSLQLDGTTFRDLFTVVGLERLDARFRDALAMTDAALSDRLSDYRSRCDPPPPAETSELLIALAPRLESFLARLFQIEDSLDTGRRSELAEDVVLDFKKWFVRRKARRYRGTVAESFAALDGWLDGALAEAGLDAAADREFAIARLGAALREDEKANAESIDRLIQWCVLGLNSADGKAAVAGWASFKLPQRVDHAHLVPLTAADADRLQRRQVAPERFRHRDGFRLTDPRMTARQVRDEVHYCIYCHDHDGDFCSKGFPEKKGEPELGLKVDPLGVTLTGCPLDEKVSEMHILKRDGHPIGALAVAMVDNPMIPATGHRICNDCMKGCIYQKQDPVNIPQVETRILMDVLMLPWGVEIYDLLTRWNPLRRAGFLPKRRNGRRVLIAGMGPAGFTMAHYLTQEGCTVVGIDGLKIEPLPRARLKNPVRDWSELEESLEERILLGFGGVAEYGITVRWDKNFLKLIYLSLARRAGFQVFGGVRFGGTLTLDDAWALGFDHVCVATGAGLPKVIHMGAGLARGMRQANDFLMALQLTGAGKESSLANLQVRLPAVVIGGGLTAIDTATEVQAHYIKQTEKLLARFETLAAARGEDVMRAVLGTEDLRILDEFLDHGRAVRAERARAAKQGEDPDFRSLVRAWGGVTLAYRKGLNASPAYLRNHEEVIKAMEEGLYYLEGMSPLRCELDEFQHVSALVCRRMNCVEGRWLASNEEVSLPAKSVFVAAGASPNTIYEHEHPGTFELEADHFLPHVQHGGDLQPAQVAEHCKSPEFAPFTSVDADGRFVTFLGDTHPVFHGSVVKAIASAKRSYPEIMAALESAPANDASPADPEAFGERMDALLSPRVAAVDSSNPAVTELWVKAPMAARNFRPGQFFRLQTFESTSPVVAGTRLQIPLMTVSGTGVRGDEVRLLVLQWGPTAKLVARLEPGDPIVLMGPTGAPTDIPHDRTVLIVAGRWGSAVMLDIGPELRGAGNRVVYFSTLDRAADVDHQDELEAAADQIIWCTATGPAIEPRRPQDLSVVSNDVMAVLHDYAAGRIRPASHSEAIALGEVDRIMIMGATGLLQVFQSLLTERPGELFRKNVEALGTVGSPMQCMLKGVCAQCLQWQVDPRTGERTRAVFSCAGQDQPLTWIDLDNLAARQGQNRLLDQLTGIWVDHVLTQEGRVAE